jgi:5-methylthioadenosine/S-adenosylhomocysteine deaminase
MGTVRHTEAVGAALEASGIRAVFGMALMDQGVGVPAGMLAGAARSLDDALALAQRFAGRAGGRLQVSLAPRFILSCSETLWRDVAAAARERGLLIHTHVAENSNEGREVAAAVGSTAARYFATHELLSPRFVGAHGVWLEDDELAAMKSADAALVHCPGSNLKLGSGLANVRRWRAAGIRSGLGSDGAACNNRLDTFHEMSVAAGLSRVLEPARPLAAADVFALATIDGADALGLAGRIGSLETGQQADLAIVAADTPQAAPVAERDPYTTLVHACRPSDVKLTMVAGRVLYRAGTWTTLDAGRITATARTEAQALVRRMEAA